MATRKESSEKILLAGITGVAEREASTASLLEMPVEPGIERVNVTDDYGRFLVSPLERGFGITLGNALRRVLLGGLTGAAATFVKIEGVLHEFSTLPGIMEDTTEMILNVKKVRFRLHTNDPKLVRIEVKGEREVTAKDIQGSSEVEVLNPDQHIASLADKNARLTMEIGVSKGKGYVSGEAHSFEPTIGLIPIDSIFSPIYKVNYFVEDTRVGQSTEYEKLHLELWTDKSVRPDEALSAAARLLDQHIMLIADLGKGLSKQDRGGSKASRSALEMTMEDLELSVRSYNCLKRANIGTVGDLVKYSVKDLMNVRNFGKKSLDEIAEKLAEMNLSLREDGDDE